MYCIMLMQFMKTIKPLPFNKYRLYIFTYTIITQVLYYLINTNYELQIMNYELYRLHAVQSPIIPVVGELIKNSPGTISLGQGVVHYSPAPEAIEILPKFLNDSTNNLYKAVTIIPELLTVLTANLSNFNGIDINTDNCIVVTADSNIGFMNAILAITSPGDEIILNIPYYFNHEMAITMAGYHPVLVATTEDYQLIPESIAKAITPKTHAIVTISPKNPTGAVY